MKTIGWCFIGCGTLVRKEVAKQITESGRHKIVSVYTRRFEAGKEFISVYGGQAYATPGEAIMADGVDAVYVATPHNTHYFYTKMALDLGKPVLCEKPFTMNAKEAKELFELAKEKKLYAAEAMWTWFSPIANRVKAWMDAGEFGELTKVVAHYHLDVRRYAPRLTDPNLAGGALLDSGIYPLTYLYRLFGKPVKVECRGRLNKGIDLGEDVTLTFPDGRVITSSISICDCRGIEVFSLHGKKAKVRIFFFHAAKKAVLKRRYGPKEVLKLTPSQINKLNEFNIVADEIQEGLIESRMVPAQATVDVMEILDECRHQMKLIYPFEK